MTTAVALYTAIVTAAGATLGLLAWIGHISRRLHRSADVVDRIGRILEPDGDAPGLSERLRALESGQRRIEAQLRPNGGSSARDAINRVEAGLQTLNSRLPPPD